MISQLMIFISRLSRTTRFVEFISNSDFYLIKFTFLMKYEEESVPIQ